MCSIVEDASHYCKTQLKEKTFYYTWSIEDFRKIYAFGEVLKSSQATNNFVFYMYPEEDKVEFYGLMSQMKKHDYQPSTTSFYSIFLKTNMGKICKKKNAKCSMSQNTKTLLYDIPISTLFDKRKNELNYIFNRTLTIYFEFHTLIDVNNCSINHSYETSAITDTDIFVPNEISNSFVTFVVNKEQTLQANKVTLSLKSKVFKAMFDCGLKESQTNEIEITDIRYDTLKELLSFVETGYLTKRIEEINPGVTCELFITADKYDIEDLKLKCELCLIRNTTIENVVEHLKIAHLNNGKILEKYAKDFIKLYLKDIMNTPNFITLMLEYPELLIQIKNITNTSARAIFYSHNL